MKRLALWIVGILLILAGIIGLIAPIIPGWPLLFIGLSLIAPRVAVKLRIQIEGRLLKKRVHLFEEWHSSGVHAGITTRHFPILIANSDDFKKPEIRSKLKALFLKYTAFVHPGYKYLGGFALLNQVHEDRIAVLEQNNTSMNEDFHYLPATDAVITNIKDLNLVVLTADCLSVYLWAGEWVGLVHAGWRGTHKQITAKTYELMRQKSGQNEVKVIFGPCIRRDNYEVGPEFKKYFKESLFEKDGKLYFDLAGENERQLLNAGAKKENILDVGICTVNENRTFYSFRKEKAAAGRMISFIRISVSDQTKGAKS